MKKLRRYIVLIFENRKKSCFDANKKDFENKFRKFLKEKRAKKCDWRTVVNRVLILSLMFC